VASLIKNFLLNGVEHVFESRHDVVKLLPDNAVGIELGTGSGLFAKTILEKFPIQYLYTVDHFGNENINNKYQHALFILEQQKSRSSILKMTFRQATKLFPNNHFDFIYVDGYAHTGHDQGSIYHDRWPLLKVGGVFAGDDYDSKFPLVIKNIEEFAKHQSKDLYVIDCLPGEDWASKCPTWFMIK
jgi:hypothetical protein